MAISRRPRRKSSPSGRRINSKSKGAGGERELAARLREIFPGYPIRRGQQYAGLEAPDVVGLPGIHVECKRRNRLNVHQAMRQAIDDVKKLPDAHAVVPVVFHRADDQDWLVTCTLRDLLRFACQVVDLDEAADLANLAF